MPLTITDTEMTSDETTHTAKLWPFEGEPTWSVTWLPGRILTTGQAVTAMTIAETVACHAEHIDEHGDWELFVDGWAAELGLTGPIAIAEAIKPRLTFTAREDGHNRVGHKCPPWCTEDHDELLIPGKPEHGYMNTHKSDPIMIALANFGHAEVTAVWHSDAPMVRLVAAYGREYLDLSVKDARALAAILPGCLPFSGELPVVDAILSLTGMITAAAAPAEVPGV